MCGVAGIIDMRGRRQIAPARLKRMTDAIARRGPDGEGAWLLPGVALGHRRLAIIDPEGGRQPMVSSDGRVAVVFNGMIYNFRALRRELEAVGRVFLTDCDTEVLLHGWRVWGAALPERLDGFFAAAIWDEDAETLCLIRDFWGKKPLFLAESDGFLLFGSDADALGAAFPGALEPEPGALADYLALGYIPEPTSFWKGLSKLPPASRLVWRRGAPRPEAQTWGRLRLDPQDRGQSLPEAAAELDGLLRAAVRKRLIADVPVGAFLSGGLDSGAVLALMSLEGAAPARACTMGFDDPALDESALAALMAQRWNAEHAIERVSVEDMADLEALAGAYGEPFADASALPSLRLCRLAARRVKVALSGDGGDEIFAGYRRYPFHLREERFKATLPAILRGPMFGALARMWPQPPGTPRFLRARATFEALSGDQAAGLLRATAIMDERGWRALLAPSLRAALKDHDPARHIRAALNEADTDDSLARAQYADLKTWLPGRMLVKIDRASMAAGVEARNPLLDKDLALWAARLPTRLKLEGFQGKRVLRAALEPYAPPEILTAPKRGFVAPIQSWMRGRWRPLMEALPKSPSLNAFLDAGEIARLWRETDGGRADHSRALWAILALEGALKRSLSAGA